MICKNLFYMFKNNTITKYTQSLLLKRPWENSNERLQTLDLTVLYLISPFFPNKGTYPLDYLLDRSIDPLIPISGYMDSMISFPHPLFSEDILLVYQINPFCLSKNPFVCLLIFYILLLQTHTSILTGKGEKEPDL